MADRGPLHAFTAVIGTDTHVVRVARLGDGCWEVTIDDGPAQIVDGRRTGTTSYSIVRDGAAHEVHVLARRNDYAVTIGGHVHRLQLLDERALRARGGSVGGGDRELRAIMPGKVVAVLVAEGAVVEQGQGILVIEAMKMENEIQATRSGTVTRIGVEPGQAVESGELLAVIDD